MALLSCNCDIQEIARATRTFDEQLATALNQQARGENQEEIHCTNDSKSKQHSQEEVESDHVDALFVLLWENHSPFVRKLPSRCLSVVVRFLATNRESAFQLPTDEATCFPSALGRVLAALGWGWVGPTLRLG